MASRRVQLGPDLRERYLARCERLLGFLHSVNAHKRTDPTTAAMVAATVDAIDRLENGKPVVIDNGFEELPNPDLGYAWLVDPDGTVTLVDADTALQHCVPRRGRLTLWGLA